MTRPANSMTFDPVRLVVHATRAAAERAVADAITEQITATPAATLGLATGRSPIGVYDALVERHRAGRLSFARVTTFNLDEYWPIAPESDGSFHRFMRERLFDHVDIGASRWHLPDGAAAEERLDEECADYEARIEAAGGIDLQLLGIGENGHLAFNEPGSSRSGRTRRVRLAASTRRANRFAFPDREVPTDALTMGLGTILDARSLIVLVSGEAKAPALTRALTGVIGPESPASFLRDHAHVTVHADRAAAAGLSDPSQAAS